MDNTICTPLSSNQLSVQDEEFSLACVSVPHWHLAIVEIGENCHVISTGNHVTTLVKNNAFLFQESKEVQTSSRHFRFYSLSSGWTHLSSSCAICSPQTVSRKNAKSTVCRQLFMCSHRVVHNSFIVPRHQVYDYRFNRSEINGCRQNFGMHPVTKLYMNITSLFCVTRCQKC